MARLNYNFQILIVNDSNPANFLWNWKKKKYCKSNWDCKHFNILKSYNQYNNSY